MATIQGLAFVAFAVLGPRQALCASALHELRTAAPRPAEAPPAVQAVIASDASKAKSSSWAPGAIESPADGAVLTYRSRFPSHGGGIPTVFGGGLTVADSFATLFQRPGEPSGPQFFLYFRGQPPSDWTYTRSVLASDALDMARMILTAGRASGMDAANLVAHSYSCLAFQRMTQLSSPEVREALAMLGKGRVVLVNAATHFKGSEASAGPGNAQYAQAVRSTVDWLDGGDRLYGSLPGWIATRNATLATWTSAASAMTVQHLSQSWGSGDSVRQELLRQAQANAFDPGWQEGVLRRTNETSRLEFTTSDVAHWRSLGLKVDILHAERDQLIPWAGQKLFLELLGIRPPDACPPPGTVLTDPGGSIRLIIVDGDHYYPLKDPAALSRSLP